MLHKLHITAALVLAVIMLGTPVSAQNGPNGDVVRQELERTDELIQQAREVVLSSNSVIAAQALDQAVALQTQAWDEFSGRRYGQAYAFTKKARDRAALAVSNSRQTEQLEGVVQAKLEQAGDLLQRAHDALAGNAVDNNLGALFDNARNNLDRAWEFFRGRSYRPALKLAEQVEQAAQKLMDLAQEGQRLDADYHRWAENVDRLLDYARDLGTTCDSRAGHVYLEQAEKARAAAESLYADGHPAGALQALKQARNAARLSARECHGIDNLQQRYERLRAEADRPAEDLRSYDGTEREVARKLLDQTYQQLDLASKHLADDDMEATQIALQAAQLALRQAQRYIAGEF